MQRVIWSLILLIAIAGNCYAQPQFAKGGGTGTSGIFLNSASANRIQEWYNPSDFSPSITSGVITHVWFRNSTANQTGTYTDFTLKLAQPSSGTGFPSTTFLTTGFTTVINSASQVLNGSSTAADWWSIQLTTPYTYDATKPLVFEIQFTNRTGGISTYASAGTGIKKLYTNSSTATTGTDHTSFWQDFGVTLQACPAPTITVNPGDRTFCTGQSTSFAVTATGAQSYRWQLNTGSGFTNLSDNATYSGTTTPGLSITNAPATFGGYQYRCVVTAVCSTASSSVNSTSGQLLLQPTATITSHTAADTLCQGGSSEFSVTAANANSHQWLAGSATSGYLPLSDGAQYTGTSSNKLYINNAGDTLAGLHYRCIVTGPCNTDTTDPIPLVLLKGPVFITDPVDHVVLPHQNAVFQADADGAGQPMQFFWQASYDGVNFSNINASTIYQVGGNVLEVMNVTGAQGGMHFRCIVKSASPHCGAIYDTSKSARLIINEPQSVGNTSYNENDLVVYPQPVIDVLNYSFWSNQSGKAYMTINDVSGKTLLSEIVPHTPGRTTGTLNISGLTPGVYIISCSTNDQKIIRRIIKQ